MDDKNIYKEKESLLFMNKRGGISFWDILLYLGIALILGWALLKSLGIIHSPN
jgi:hypothetical protein